MAQEPKRDWEKIVGSIIVWIFKFIWKLILMFLWMISRLAELISGQIAKGLKEILK